MGFKKYYRDNL